MAEQVISTSCFMCFNSCGIQVKLKDGVVVGLQGHPDSPMGKGKMCAKGNSAIMNLYNPYRPKSPLRRTNPRKGPGEDPRWEAISWDEALDIVARRLKKVKEEDPRKLIVDGIDFGYIPLTPFFAYAFGSPNAYYAGADYFCGNGVHPIIYMLHGAFEAHPDLHYCNYHMAFGTNAGFILQAGGTNAAREMAEARLRGMKLVVVDPVAANSAAKANEWVAIRPGTDGMLVLAMINQLLNELNIYDAGFLRTHTNAPYLVGPDGYYVRDQETGKPLIWDEGASMPLPYDAVKPEHSALTGTYQVRGVKSRPAFDLLREHVKQYTPEKAAKVTTISAETICRLAREFGEAAQVGSTVVIEGKELPLRPACVAWDKGVSMHKNGFLTGLACGLLNVLVGAIDVPGGLMGSSVVGPDWAFAPQIGPDGMLVAADAVGIVDRPFPLGPITPPKDRVDLKELFPLAPYSDVMVEDVVLSPEKWKLDYRPEVLIVVLSNMMMSCSSRERMTEVFKRFDMVVYMGMQLNETAEMADIVLPLTEGLERLVPLHNMPPVLTPVGRDSSHVWAISQPTTVVNQNRNQAEIFIELAERLGIREDFNATWNAFWGLRAPYSLDPKKKYKHEELVDLLLKGLIGPDFGLAAFRRNGFVALPKKIDEAYPRHFLKARIPVYCEHFLWAGKQLKKMTREIGLEWDTSAYQPMPHWEPCPAFEENNPGYDFFLINYKLTFHTFSHTLQNAWLDEIAEHHPWAYRVAINKAVADKKGIKEGDEVWIEAAHGVKAKGKAHITQCIHPQVVGVAGTFGRWAGPSPIGKGKGIHYNDFHRMDVKYLDPLGCTVDACVKVKLYKAEG